MIDVIGKRKIFLSIAALLVVAALVALGVFGLESGIEFRGGTLWRFSVGEEVEGNDIAALEEMFSQVSFNSAEESFLVRLPETDEPTHRELLALLEERYPSFEELSFQSVGPSVGERVRNRSLIALALVLVGISLYIAFAFRKIYRPVSSWTYGLITLLTLMHDVAIPTGLLAVLGAWKGVEMDTTLVVALLVVMGFSVHDTIVVFDRIRENLLRERGGKEFGEVINGSVNQVLARSVNTSLTLILVLLALLVLGPSSLYYFVLALLVGVLSGVYSSIFVASPLLYVSQRLLRKGRS